MTQLLVGFRVCNWVCQSYRTLLEFGRRLSEVGVLDTPEDVFHPSVRRPRTHFRRGLATTTVAARTRGVVVT